MNEFIRKLNEYNLCTWYILPMQDLNVDSFGSAAFMNSYLVKKRMQIVVQVVDQNLCRGGREHSCYRGSYERDGSDFMVFDIPEGWKTDIQNYLQGSYSKFTYFTKCKIQEKSGLNYQARDENGQKYTDAILLALDQHQALRSKWIEILGDDVELPEELLSKPRPEAFIEDII